MVGLQRTLCTGERMAKHDENPTTDLDATPATITLQVVPVTPVSRTVATLDAAFMLLCEAMVVALDANDDLPGVMHAEEIMGWYQNGNTAIAWQHAVLLLETAIGVPLRGMT